jgi:hypothetical protein
MNLIIAKGVGALGLALIIFGLGYKAGAYVTYNTEHNKVVTCEQAISESNAAANELQTRLQTIVISNIDTMQAVREYNAKSRDEIIKDYEAKLASVEIPAACPVPPVGEPPTTVEKPVPAPGTVRDSPPPTLDKPPEPMPPNLRPVVLPPRFGETVNALLAGGQA